MNVKLLAIVAVAVVVVAGAGGYLLLSDDSDDGKDPDTEARLQIYGNANNDDYIDDEDLDKINEIIQAAADDDDSNDVDWAKEYPYADADADGDVDENDAIAVKDLIERKEGITVRYTDGTGTVRSIEYPVKSVCVLGTATFTAAKALGMSDMIYGRSGTSQTNDAIFSDLWEKPAVSSTMIDFDIPLFSNVADNVEGGSIDAVVQNSAGMGAPIDSDEMAELESLGTATITMNFDSADEAASYLTLGFLCGKETEAHKVVDLIDGVYETVAEAVEKAGSKPTVLCAWITGSMGTGIYAVSGDSVAGFVTAAGGSLISVPDDNMDISNGTVGILDDKYNADFILAAVRTDVSYTDTVEDWKTVWEENTSDDSTLHYLDACPENTYLLMYSMPFIAKVAYAVEILYPDQVDDGYGDSINQQWVDMCYLGNLGSDYKVADHGFCVGAEDFGDSGDEDTVATSISMIVSEVSLAPGETKTLGYTTTPAGSKAEGSTVWTSSDEGVATVDAGTVTAVSDGTATITLAIGELTATCTVTVATSSDNDYSSTVTEVGANDIASTFVSTYTDGAFGTYSVSSGGTSQSASAEYDTGSSTMGTTKICFSGNTAASQIFEDSKSYAYFSTTIGMPGETMTEVTYNPGFDGIVAYKHEASSMATFTIFCFSAYVGDVVVDGYTDYQYRAGSLAIDEEIQALLDAVYTAVTDAAPSTTSVTGVALSDETATIAAGDTVRLTYTLEPSGAAAESVVWTSSDESVATVDSGTVTGVAYGTATITLTVDGFSATCDVVVTSATQMDAGADAVASAFATGYTEGSFGTYAVSDGADGSSATVSSGEYYFTLLGDSDPASLFETLQAKVDAKKATVMGAAKQTIDASSIGFDGVATALYEVNMTMGSTTVKMNMFYFAAYKGNVVADGITTSVQVDSDGETAADQYKAFFQALYDAMAGSQTVTDADADDHAAAFVTGYTSGSTFGTMSDATGDSRVASVDFATGSRVAPTTTVTFIGCTDASDRLAAAKTAIDADVADTGMTSASVENTFGFDGFYAVTIDMSMGTTAFTMLYFAAYEGDVFVDGYTTYQLHRSTAATADELTAYFTALASAVGATARGRPTNPGAAPSGAAPPLLRTFLFFTRYMSIAKSATANAATTQSAHQGNA